MGGGVKSSCSFSSSPDDQSSLDDDQSHCSSDDLGLEFDEMGNHGKSSNQVPFAKNLKEEELKAIINSYRGSSAATASPDEAKRLVLSYTPGSWIDKEKDEKLSDFNIPKTTTLLVVGFKGSGKSSLINRISRVFEDDKLASDRAQVSYCPYSGDGTCFLQGYMIPRQSSSFCLFDTRSLSDDVHDNDILIKSWMKNGVRHGELVISKSDDSSMRNNLKCKIRYDNTRAGPVRKVNYVIFVVDGLSMLRCMNAENEEDKRGCQTLARAYNSSYLSFKDDKPVIVVTRGDLLSDEERARVRIYLGELLGAPPATQIFDIPESGDPVAELATLKMLKFALERADKNLPHMSLARTNSSWSDFFSEVIILIATVMVSMMLCMLVVISIRAHGYHNSMVNHTLAYPARTQDCNHYVEPPTRRETSQIDNLDISNSTTQNDSSQSQVKSTPKQSKVRDKRHRSRVRPGTRSAKPRSKARKETVSTEPTTNWKARQRLWLEE